MSGRVVRTDPSAERGPAGEGAPHARDLTGPRDGHAFLPAELPRSAHPAPLGDTCPVRPGPPPPARQDSTTVTLSQFRNEQSRYLDAVQREPVTILSRGTRRRAVVVSPDFYDRDIQALEDIEDIRAAAAARQEAGEISHEGLKAELGLD